MSEQELIAKEKQNAVEIYRKYGDNEQELSQAVWNDLKKIGMNPELESQGQVRRDVEKALLEQLVKESHDHHKKVWIEFPSPYGNSDHDKQHTKIGTSRGWMKDGAKDNMTPLDYPVKEVKPQTATQSTEPELTMTSGWSHSSPESFYKYDPGRKK